MTLCSLVITNHKGEIFYVHTPYTVVDITEIGGLSNIQIQIHNEAGADCIIVSEKVYIKKTDVQHNEILNFEFESDPKIDKITCIINIYVVQTFNQNHEEIKDFFFYRR
jgi:hypothetical protein